MTSQEDRSWEDLEFIQQLIPNVNLEDKLRLKDDDEVTVVLDFDEVIRQLGQDLQLDFSDDKAIKTVINRDNQQIN